MEILEILLLALVSMIWPALIAVVVVALGSSQPVRLLSWFLAGALLTTVTIGIALVNLLRESKVVTGSRPTFGSAVDLVAGAASLLAAYFLWRRGRTVGSRPPKEKASPGWSERTLTRGGVLAFVVGIVLNVLPGVAPLVALKDIAELDYGWEASLAFVGGFYLVMFIPAEVPLLSYLVAPARTTAAVGRFNRWLKRNARELAVYVLVAVGIYLSVRGVLSL